ncbi:MAG TPA: amidohydrolase family protein [Thermoanaerobaculia bacterium]|jgi:predicted TIM-barrel fold metal-dependent hydrolase|nr:amidohydrolase family protein [Thermoanaerobaculia bacterium]
MPVIDAHLHVQPHDEFNAESRTFIESGRRDLERYSRIERSPDELLRFFDEQEIEAGCLINYVAPDTLGLSENVNAWIVRYCRDHRDRLIAVGSVHPRFSKDAYGDTRRLFDSGIRMIKLHPPHQLFSPNDYLGRNEMLAGIYRAAEEARVPVMIHTGTSTFPSARNRFADPMAIDDVAVDFPNLPIVLAHSGRPLYGETAFFLARRHPNVRLELSGIPPKKLLEHLPRLEEVAGKTLWGTDWPSPGIVSPSANVAAFRALPLSDAAKEKILYSNAKKLFG